MVPNSGSSPSHELASFVTDLCFEKLPQEAVLIAKRSFVDTIGVILGGSTEPAGQIATDLVTSVSDGGSARILGTGIDAPPLDAAFANGVAGHALHFDDMSSILIGHPGPALISSILAVSEQAAISGSEAITAYIAGLEVECYLATALNPEHYERGWHATATFGTFGAAAATAYLLDLTASEIRYSLNMCASLSGGLRINTGSMTNPLHVGHATRSGMLAAHLASKGFTADVSAIGDDGGFLDLFSGGCGPDTDSFYPLGEQWATLKHGVHLKKYPCCYYAHTGIATTSMLVDQHDLRPEDIKSVQVTASPAAGELLPYVTPSNETEARLSMHHPISACIVDGPINLESFEEPTLKNSVIVEFRNRVTFEIDTSLPYDSTMATVEIETIGDQKFSKRVEHPPGTDKNPMTPAEIEEKFFNCANRAVRTTMATTVFERVMELSSLNDVSDIASPV